MSQLPLLLKGLMWDGSVLIHVDARRPEVDVPAHLRDQAQLVLRVGTDMRPRIPDLEVDDAGVRASLTFSGYLYRCVLPWSAIYVLRSERTDEALVIQDNVPADVKSEPPAEPTPDKPRLKLVD